VSFQKDYLRAKIKATGAIQEGHVQHQGLGRKKHSDKRLIRERLSGNLDAVEALGHYLVHPFRHEVKQYYIDEVVALSHNGQPFAKQVAVNLDWRGRRPNVVTVGTYFYSDDFAKIIRNKNILIVEDYIDESGRERLKKVISWLSVNGGKVVGLGLVYRHKDIKREDLKKDIVYVGSDGLETKPEVVCADYFDSILWDENDCPMCQKFIPQTATFKRGGRFFRFLGRLIRRKNPK